ncbi:hypothetical protein ARSEF4850_010117, partial [Beauveria asiatica]
MDKIVSSLESVSFFAAVVVCGILSIRIIVPPNHTPRASAWKSDSIAFYAGNNVFIYMSIVAVSAINLYYAALVASPPATAARICPVGTAARLNPELFAWSPTTVASFLAILVAAPLRLGALHGLGRNFTFGLAKPSGLVTDGIYKYIQHPSYTGIFGGSCRRGHLFPPRWRSRVPDPDQAWAAHRCLAADGHIARLYLNQSSSDPEWGKNYEG